MIHELYMQRCLQLAEKGLGNVAPNPLVGAVLVHRERIIGEGYHQHYGQAHAEVNCFESVQNEDKHLIAQSTLYVNLEPCAHFGKTPPCANRIVQEGVKKVVIANTDPFEMVAGKGIRLLQENGIQVITGILKKEGAWLNRRFFTFHQRKRPFIILKWAQTENGLFAPKDGSRIQITDEVSQKINHQWRAEEAAILVGFNTAMNDNPQLTNRYSKGNQPLRIALDSNLTLPKSHHIFDGKTPTWVVNSQKNEEQENLRFLKLDFQNKPLENLLQELFVAGKNSVIVEGGAKLLQNFVAANLWDEARILIAPNRLKSGIDAPLLQNEHLLSATPLANDVLKIYQNISI